MIASVEGAVVGSLSLVTGPLAPWSVYAGVPARLIRPRLRAVADRAGRLEREP